MGIQLAYSSNSSVRQQLQCKSTICVQPNGTDYTLNCSGCPEVYVGQTGREVEKRAGNMRQVPKQVDHWMQCTNTMHSLDMLWTPRTPLQFSNPTATTPESLLRQL